MKVKRKYFSSFKFCWRGKEPDTGVVLRPGAGFSLMEHTNSLNGIDVSAKCLHRPLLTYLMNHFQQTATPTNNNDPSFLNIKRSKYSTEHRRDTFAVLRSELQAMEAKYKGGRKSIWKWMKRVPSAAVRVWALLYHHRLDLTMIVCRV